jgi:hypothetical protein
MMTGLWQGSRRVDSGFWRTLGLAGQTKVSVNGKGELIIPDLKGPGGAARKWVEVEPFVWREADGQERLSAKVVDGQVVRWSVDSMSPWAVFDRVPAAQSSAWILPAIYTAIGVLALTFLQWPAAALVRRHFKAPAPLAGRAWMLTATGLLKDLSQLTSAADGKLWTLQILGLIVFVGAVALSGLHVVLTWRGKRGWAAKVWSIVVLLSTLMVLYIAFTFGLLDMTVNY